MQTVVVDGARVALHFTLSLPDGTTVDSSEGDEPLRITVGKGELLEGLEQRLLGLRAGDRRRFQIPALEAYGAIEQEAVQTLARADFPNALELEPGTVVGFTIPNGEEVPGLVLEVNASEVVVDFSHPLAGHDVIFDIQIVAIEAPA